MVSFSLTFKSFFLLSQRLALLCRTMQLSVSSACNFRLKPRQSNRIKQAQMFFPVRTTGILCILHITRSSTIFNKLNQVIYLHACLCCCSCAYACLSCKTSLASLCRGHANWTVKKRQGRFMFQCSPLTGAVLRLYVSWWV